MAVTTKVRIQTWRHLIKHLVLELLAGRCVLVRCYLDFRNENRDFPGSIYSNDERDGP